MRAAPFLRHRCDRRRRDRHRHQHVRRRAASANVRVDLTQQHLHAVAGHRQMLAGLKEPVTLRLFYSRQLGARFPSMAPMPTTCARCWRNTPRCRTARSRLEYYDPEPFSDTEDRAWPMGCKACRSITSGEQVYFGLAGTNLGRRAHHSVLPAGARAVPGIRSDQADLRPVQSEAPGGRRDVVAADGWRSAR
jgi:hypothetical protein